MSRGRKAEPEIAFSTTGSSTRSRSLAPRVHQHVGERQHGGGAAHVLLHVQHAAVGLMSSPPVSKQTPLPISVTFGWAGSPQLMSIEARRPVGGAADRMDERKVLRQEIVADDRAEARAMPRRQRAGGALELGRAHVVGRRVDQVAGEPDRLGDAGEVGAVDAGRQFEPDRPCPRPCDSARSDRCRARRRAPPGARRAAHWRTDRCRPAAGPARRPAAANPWRGIVASSSPNSTPASAPSAARQQEVPAGAAARSRRRPQRRGCAASRRSRISVQVAAVTNVTGTVAVALPGLTKTAGIEDCGMDLS